MKDFPYAYSNEMTLKLACSEDEPQKTTSVSAYVLRLLFSFVCANLFNSKLALPETYAWGI